MIDKAYASATAFLLNGGSQGELLRAHDWAHTSLGPLALWPTSLKALTSVMLSSGQPMFVAWGPDLTLLYNEPYAAILAAKHPLALGRNFLDVWAEIKNDLTPIVARALEGEPVQMDDIELVMHRKGFPETTHFSFYYSPIRDDAGDVAGFFCACTEITAQVMAEQRAAAERERQRLMLEQMPGFTALTSGPEHIYDYVNEAYVQIAGDRDFIGRPVRDIFPDLNTQGFFDLLDRVYTTGEAFTARSAAVQLSGETEPRYIDFIYHPIRDDAGAVTGIFIGGYEVTERVRADERLRKERDRLASVLEGMGEAFAMLDPEFRFIDLNSEGFRLTNRAPNSIIGRSYWEIYPGSEETEVGDFYQRAMKERVAVSFEHEAVLPNGCKAWLEVRVYPVPEGLAVFFRDISDRKRAEEEARVSGERIELALNAGAVLGTWVWDIPTDSVIADERFARTFGLDQQACRSGVPLSSVTQSIHPDDLSSVSAAIDVALSQGDNYRCEYRVRETEDSYRWIEANGRVERNSAGLPVRFPGVLIDIGDRKSAEAERDRSEHMLRTFMEAVPGVVYAKDRAGRMLVANRGAVHLIGKPVAEFLGKTDMEFLNDKDQAARIMATDRRVMNDNVTEQIEEAVRLADGTPATFLSTKAPLHDAAGNVIGLVGASIDVTERKRQDSLRLALIELTDRFRDLDDPAELAFAAGEILGRTLDVGRAGYAAIDPASEIITIRSDWTAPGVGSLAGSGNLRNYGGFIDDLKRGEIVVIEDAGQDPRTIATVHKMFGVGARSIVNVPLMERGDLAAFVFVNQATPRVWDAGEIAFISDVAERTRTAFERRRAEIELRALAASLEQLVTDRTAERDRVWRNSRDLLVVIGVDGIFRAINPAWTRILGHDPVEVIGRSFLDFIWEDDATLTRDGLASAARHNDLSSFENRYHHKDGGYRWVSWHTATEGNLVYAYGRDITEEKEQREALRQAEDALRQSQKMEAVGQLTGGIAHDFNNMLAVVIGSLDLLQRRIGLSDAKSARYVAAASDGARRAANLTQRLLAFSRQQPLNPESVEINRLVAGMSELLRHALGADIQHDSHPAVDLWRVHADPNQLENVILNLAVNARDAMPNGGRLLIETKNVDFALPTLVAEGASSAQQYVLISVADSGCGMPPDVLAKVFDPFFTTKEVGKGTGLGLSQAYGFVRQSGGHIDIESEPGRGTIVKLYLPRYTGSEGRDSVSVISDALPTAQRELVLVVDDEQAVRAFSAEALRELGYDVVEAESAKVALTHLRSNPDIALLFTDIIMPDVKGPKLVLEARQLYPDLKVLFTSGYSRDVIIGNGALEGGVEVISKPFTFEELAGKVREVLDTPGPRERRPS